MKQANLPDLEEVENFSIDEIDFGDVSEIENEEVLTILRQTIKSARDGEKGKKGFDL